MIQVVFWTQSGNTYAMAQAIAEGILEAGREVNVVPVESASIEQLTNDQVMALGCPSMGAEVLEETEMEPFITELEGYVAGKTIALLGSYGWGDGEWMRNWVERMTAAGATVLNGEGIICREMPDEEALEACKNLGIQLGK